MAFHSYLLLFGALAALCAGQNYHTLFWSNPVKLSNCSSYHPSNQIFGSNCPSVTTNCASLDYTTGKLAPAGNISVVDSGWLHFLSCSHFYGETLMGLQFFFNSSSSVLTFITFSDTRCLGQTRENISNSPNSLQIETNFQNTGCFQAIMTFPPYYESSSPACYMASFMYTQTPSQECFTSANIAEPDNEPVRII